MDWTSSIIKAIDYIESNLFVNIGSDDIAQHVNISSFYFQKAFGMITGYTVGEYIRNRRMYLAAIEVCTGESKVIDIAYKYGYDTPESFTKAFTRFHGISPQKMNGDSALIKTFLPLKVSLCVKGGRQMDYRLEKMKSFKVIGIKEIFGFEDSFKKIPKFWERFVAKYCNENTSPILKPIIDNSIGELGICVSNNREADKFSYYIAGFYKGGEVPTGFEVFEIAEYDWLKFSAIGPMPGALQSVNTQIFREFMPGNPEFEFASNISIEWYSQEDMASPNYHSEIWLPVNKK